MSLEDGFYCTIIIIYFLVTCIIIDDIHVCHNMMILCLITDSRDASSWYWGDTASD